MRVNVRYLVVEVTERCNNNCAHCYNYWRGNGAAASRLAPLPRAEIRDLVEKVLLDAPIEQVALSGGEPLLRPDVAEIATDLSHMGLRAVVITNGSLLDQRRIERFPEGCVFEVTLFSPSAEIHDDLAGRKRHKKLLEDLALLTLSGHFLVIATVITSKNVNDVYRTIQLAIALRAQAVLLNRVNLSRQMYSQSPTLVPSVAQIRGVLADANAAAGKYGITVLVSVPIPPCIADPRDYPQLQFGWCPRGGADAYYAIGVTGEVRPCNHSSVILGDLRKSAFGEIVAGKKARAFWTPVPPECVSCTHPLKDRCRGGCPAASDECFRDRLQIDPFVGLARAVHSHRTLSQCERAS